MGSKGQEKAQQPPVPEQPKRVSDLPEVVSDEDGKLIKGGPSSHPWKPKPPI